MGTFKTQVPAALAGLAISVATLVLMVATESSMAIGWDEGYTLGREARIRDWFRALYDPVRFAAQWRPLPLEFELVQETDRTQVPSRDRLDSRGELLSDPTVLAWFWPFAREEPHGHPPFYALLGLVGDILAPSWQDLPRARLGPILLFSLTAGAIWTFVRSRWGAWPAVLAVGSWILQPRLFGHGHYAAYDAILTALWVLSIIAFAQAVLPVDGSDVSPEVRRRAWIATFGVILGCAAATKFTGWFLPIPFLAWSCHFRSRSGFAALLVGGLIAFAIVVVLTPPWWHAPFSGLIRFLESNLSRAITRPIRIEFLGTVYNSPRDSLPWFNTLVWTLFVTPIGFLLFAVAGLWRALRRYRSEPIGLLIAGHWAFLMLLRALPHTPAHDGVRLFLPAFGVLSLLAGLGARSFCDKWNRAVRPAVVMAVLEGAVSIAVMMPVPLAYYSPLVGGLPGARALGMEPTYYWDALDVDARRWLIEHTEQGATIQFATFPHSWLYLRSIGALPRGLAPVDRGQPKWYVLQNRPGSFSSIDAKLAQHGRAAYTATKLGVPLIWIFSVTEVERVRERKSD